MRTITTTKAPGQYLLGTTRRGTPITVDYAYTEGLPTLTVYRGKRKTGTYRGSSLSATASGPTADDLAYWGKIAGVAIPAGVPEHGRAS